MYPRRQLAAYSPLSAGDLIGAVRASVAHAHEVERARALVTHAFQADTALLVDSGRSALQLAISIASRKLGGATAVGLPAFQCFEVASAAVGANCSIAFYDIDPHSLGPDLESLESLLRAGVRVVVIAPLYGVPVDWEQVQTLADRYGAIAIEDAAQAHGASWRGRVLGSLGALSVVSFGRGKGWTGCGGGALCARGDFAREVSQAETGLARASVGNDFRVALLATAQWAAGRPALYGIPAGIPALGLGETRYHDPTAPAEMSSYSAGVLIRTQAAATLEGDARLASGAYWRASLPPELLAGVPIVAEAGTAGYLRFPLRVSAQAYDSATSPIAQSMGVARSYPVALNTLDPVRPRLQQPAMQVAGAELLARTLVTLPTHSLVSQSDRRLILDLCAEWVDSK
jgi:dTDP-4-amino-4,6-dideoxygalactose transaminase